MNGMKHARAVFIVGSVILAMLPGVLLVIVLPHGYDHEFPTASSRDLTCRIQTRGSTIWSVLSAQLVARHGRQIHLATPVASSQNTRPFELDLYVAEIIHEVFQRQGLYFKYERTSIFVPLLTFGLWAVLFLVYPTVVFFRGPYRRHRRRKKGLCLNCGYSLTGNVSGVCPDCGEQI
jgi:hypothetical protein